MPYNPLFSYGQERKNHAGQNTKQRIQGLDPDWIENPDVLFPDTTHDFASKFQNNSEHYSKEHRYIQDRMNAIKPIYTNKGGINNNATRGATALEVMRQGMSLSADVLILPISNGAYGHVFHVPAPGIYEFLKACGTNLRDRKYSDILPKSLLVSGNNFEGRVYTAMTNAGLNVNNVYIKVQEMNEFADQLQFVKEDVITRAMNDVKEGTLLKVTLPGKNQNQKSPFVGVNHQFAQFLCSGDLVLTNRAPRRITVMQGLDVKMSLHTYIRKIHHNSAGFATMAVYFERAVLAMWLSGFYHGDLHLNNVLVCAREHVGGPGILSKVPGILPCIVDFGFAQPISAENLDRLKEYVKENYMTPSGINYRSEFFRDVFRDIRSRLLQHYDAYNSDEKGLLAALDLCKPEDLYKARLEMIQNENTLYNVIKDKDTKQQQQLRPQENKQNPKTRKGTVATKRQYRKTDLPIEYRWIPLPCRGTGQERNPKSGRCKKYAQPCVGAKKGRNPDTGRCKTYKAACKPQELRDPMTGTCKHVPARVQNILSEMQNNIV